jgi:hypothetical protein
MANTETNSAATEETKVSPAAILNAKLGENITLPLFRDETVKFSFKSERLTEEEIKAGITKEQKQAKRRPPVVLEVPVLTGDGLIAVLEQNNEKTFNYILDLVNDAIRGAAREQVSPLDESAKAVTKQQDLDISKLDIHTIASQPKSERGGGISKDTWEAFEADYVAVMPEAAGKSEDRVKKAAAILVKRLVPVQNQKDILEFFKNELALYISKTPNAEEFAEVYQFLDTKIDTLLQKDSTELLNSL